MAIRDLLLAELDQEMTTTRSLLAIVPEADAAWKPHPKSMSLGELAVHLANLVYWGTATVRDDGFDMKPAGQPAWTPPKFESTAGNLKIFDANLAEVKGVLMGASDEALMQPWSLRAGEQVYFTMPKLVVWRTFV
ncbi:MAG TPA: DinB family protein, partial [Gemmatimonadales bacterium]